jgi:hypothetical protein
MHKNASPQPSLSLSYATENCSVRYHRGTPARWRSRRSLTNVISIFAQTEPRLTRTQTNDSFHVHRCVFGVENECLAMKQVSSPCGRIVLNVHSHGCLDRRRLERIRLPQRGMMGLMKCRLWGFHGGDMGLLQKRSRVRWSKKEKDPDAEFGSS